MANMSPRLWSPSADDAFGVMSDQLVDIFQNNCVNSCDEPAHFMTSGDDAGKCNGQANCPRVTVMWNTDDHQTDGNGNIFYGADIGATHRNFAQW